MPQAAAHKEHPMRILTALFIAFALSLAGATLAHAKETPAASYKVDKAKVVEHLRKHQTYPATKAQLLKACEDLKDFEPGEKEWFTQKLPEKTYKSAEEVEKALGI
jgi:hypothetical protein